MAILIADSGGTKTDWRLLDQGFVHQFITDGFNPYSRPKSKFVDQIKLHLGQRFYGIKKLFFYGAGLNGDQILNALHTQLQNELNIPNVFLESDLLAAARASCLHSEGITCILGTGSNSGYYDGQVIAHQIPSLGYILGDEGSGATLGKELLKMVVRGDLNEDLFDRFSTRFAIGLEEILNKVYRSESPTEFLSSFSKFIFQNQKDPQMYNLVYVTFKTFFDSVLMKYKDVSIKPIHFTGSVAFYYSNILRQLGNDLGLSIRTITESPIAGLTLFHESLLKK